MKPSSATLLTMALVSLAIGFVCVAQPIVEPAQQVAADNPGNSGHWLLFDHPDVAHHQQAAQSAPGPDLQVVAAATAREKRQAANKKKKTKPDKKGSFEKECLVAHNKWRKLHQAEPLVWDKKITEFSRKRANFIAESDGSEFKHPADLEYGENLAWHSRETTSCSDLIKMWYDEVDLYDFNKAKFDHETGHFTQLVWRSTRSVGCAKAVSVKPRGGVYLVCNYDPPGNFLGEESENVLVALEKVVAAAKPSPSPPATTPAPATTTTPTTTTTTIASTTTTSTVAPTSGGAQETSGSSSVAKKKNKKNKKTDKSERKKKKKGNKNKKNKKRRNKKKKNNKKKQASTSTSTTSTTSTIATPTG